MNLVQHRKNEVSQLMKMENSKTNEPHKFVLNLLQNINLRSLNKDVHPQNLSIY